MPARGRPASRAGERRVRLLLYMAGMRLAFAIVALATIAASCGGRSLTGTDAGAARVPQRHRPTGQVCPVQRGPGSGAASHCLDPVECGADSDCKAGTNGRCQPLGGPIGPASCGTTCSYDACATDADCPSNEPCECRTSPSDSTANVCLTSGNCRVDGDCGPGGYCSPSQLEAFCFCPSAALCADGSSSCYADNVQVPCVCGDSCGHGYFCHTANDTCLDDADCGGDGTCNYDTVDRRWSCAVCWPVP